MSFPVRKALAHLRAADPVMARVIARVGRCRMAVSDEGSHFGAVAASIIYQQLSGSAAATIHGRFLGLYGDREPAPGELLSTSDDRLRSAGVSAQKARYLKDLAAHAAEPSFGMEQLHAFDDAGVIERLTAIKGVGRWTAQMFLMFRLARPDVLPDLDLGIQKGIKIAYRMRTLPKPEQVLKRGAPWAPYRTIASWYLWRLVDLPAE